MIRRYHKLESDRHTEFRACGHRIEARSSVAERCPYLAEVEGSIPLRAYQSPQGARVVP
jgi:hypothetical protein